MAEWTVEVRRRLRHLGLPPAREIEIVDELALHLTEREAELRRNGVSAADAQPLAIDEISDDDLLRGEFGRLRHIRRPPISPSGMPTSNFAASIWQDVRYGIRSLAHRPSFSLVAVLALALGIGATSAIFAAVDAVLLRPMPFPHGDRLYVPVSVNADRHIDQGSVTFADYLDWRGATDVFTNVAVFRQINVDITGDGDPERVQLAQVSEDFFHLIDVRPAAGRTLIPSDHVAGAATVAAISYDFWQARYGGASDVIGRTIHVASQPATIVGILPARMVWPDTSQIFVPMKPSAFSDDVLTRRDNMIFNALAQLRDDVSPETANARLAAMAARLARAEPTTRKGWTDALVPLRAYIVDTDLSAALYVLLGAVVAVLLIACANVASLSLVGGSARARELAVRLSLGANRRRLVQQLTIEGLLLAAAGAGLGAALAIWIMKGLAAIAPDGTPFVGDIRMNVRMLAATAALGALAALLSGLFPALSSTSVALTAALRDGAAGSGSSRRSARLRNVLVVAEVAAAVVLLTGAALLIRSFARLSHVDSGLALDRVVSARLAIPTARYPDAQTRARFGADLVAQLEADPEIESAALTSYVPAGGGGLGLLRVFLTEGRPEPPAGADVPAQWNVITPDYFATMGIRLRDGRAFTTRDLATTTPVVIVTDSFAHQMFGDERPIGRRIRSWRDENVLREVVGVVDDVKYRGLADRDRPLVYVPHSQNSWGSMLVVARARRGDPAALGPALRRHLRAIDPDLALANVQSLAESARRSVASQRYAMLLLSILAAFALGLSALGVYGVTSYVFALRRHEMGIRLALGATRANLYALVMRHGFRLVLVGLAIGIAVSALTTKLLQALLFETRATDAAAWIGMTTVVLVAATLACAVPAHAAASADPKGALRAD